MNNAKKQFGLAAVAALCMGLSATAVYAIDLDVLNPHRGEISLGGLGLGGLGGLTTEAEPCGDEMIAGMVNANMDALFASGYVAGDPPGGGTTTPLKKCVAADVVPGQVIEEPIPGSNPPKKRKVQLFKCKLTYADGSSETIPPSWDFKSLQGNCTQGVMISTCHNICRQTNPNFNPAPGGGQNPTKTTN